MQVKLETLEHSHSVSLKNSILPSQNLLYQLYHTILQHSQDFNFYFPIQHIKIIHLHNKIYYQKTKKHLYPIYVFLPSSHLSLSLSTMNKPKLVPQRPLPPNNIHLTSHLPSNNHPKHRPKSLLHHQPP